MVGYVLDNRKGNTDKPLKKIPFKTDSITINSSLSSTISIITLLLILFIYVPGQWFNVVNILTLILFKA